MSLLTPAIGVMVLLLLGVDAFQTVFDPGAHGGPLTRRTSRLLWRSWRGAAPRGEGRDGWLALGGPLLAMVTPALWALLLLLGFALIYYPWIGGFLVSPGSLRTPWAEALYYSGFTAATLGTGDIVPDQPALRLLTIVQALGGFALLSTALSYILAVYREHGRKTTLAAELDLHWEVGGDGRTLSAEEQPDLWHEHVARELLHLIGAHGQYPILHYFRPSKRAHSLALQIAPLVLLKERTDRGSGPPAPGAALVSAALDRYLEAADRRFVERAGDDEGGSGSMRRRHLRLLDYLGYAPEDAGYGVHPPAHSPPGPHADPPASSGTSTTR